MPYVDDNKRKDIFLSKEDGNAFDAIVLESIDCAGDLQYAMAIMFKEYIERNGLNYQHCNDIMGALAGAQIEFYRRTVAPYEDQKIEENGDI